MPVSDPIEAGKIAVKVRKARAQLKSRLRDGDVSHISVVKQARRGAEPATNLRITEFISTLPGVGEVKLPQILEDLAISDKKRLGKLGRVQYEKLDQFLRLRLGIESHGKTPPLTVLAGPTAVGKGTVAAYIRENYPAIKLSVSATTRPARPGEIDGVHYYFVTDEQFDRMLAEGEFLEWAVVHNAYRYGTPRQPILDANADGQLILLEIDLQGARQVSVAMPDARMVFLAPPSWDELVRRLVGRGTEGEEERTRRLETAKVELASADEFDAIIINDTVEDAAEKLVSLMQQED